MELFIHQRAIQDLETVWATTLKTNSKEKADTQYTEIIGILKRIQQDFTIGKSLENFRDGYQVFCDEHIAIFYRADQENSLEIVRILLE